MSNLSDEEKDLFIKEKFKQDNLISKKYNDTFDNFLKGELKEMKENNEKQNSTSREKRLKPKKNFIRAFAAVAACALIFTGANVYANTKGYDNIFFMIKDLTSNNNKTATKEEILSDRDTTISYSNIKIADGLFIQINRFIVKDNVASLLVKIDEEKSVVKPDKFVVTSGNTSLANVKISENDKQAVDIIYEDDFTPKTIVYNYEIKFNNNYKSSMTKLNLKIEDNQAIEIATLEIDLNAKEIDLLGKSSSPYSQISEVDLKEKLGIYSYLTGIYNFNHEEELFYLGTGLVFRKYPNASDVSPEGFIYYPRQYMNELIKEATGEELGTDINSDEFKYNASLDGYEYAYLGDTPSEGLCLSIDDLKFENGQYTVTYTYCLPDPQDYTNGNIENLDRYQATFNFVLNENEVYTKYKITSIGKVEKIASGTDTSVTDTPVAEEPTSGNVSETSEEPISTTDEHVHQYVAVEGTGHTTLDGKHTLRCSICGDVKTEPHHFGKWFSIYNNTAWTLWCQDCKTYVFTEDYSVVENSGYGMMEDENNNIPNPNERPSYDPSTVNNYASTMDWTEYWAPGLKFKYPTEWGVNTDVGTDGSFVINAESSGWAIGINKDTNDIIESYMVIDVLDQVSVQGDTREEALQNFVSEYGLRALGSYYTNLNEDQWFDCKKLSGDDSSSYYVCLTDISSGGEHMGYVADIIKITANPRENYKVTNIINKVIGEAKRTSK